MDHGTDLGGAFVRGRFAPGHCQQQVLRRTHRETGGNRHHANAAVGFGGVAHRLHCFGLVAFDGNDDVLHGQRIGHDAHAVNDFVRGLAHQSVVAGDVRLTFRAVDHQGVNAVFVAHVEFDRRWERGAAQAHNASRSHAFTDFLGCHGQGKVGGDGCDQFGPAVVAIGFNHHGGLRQARRMRRHALLNGNHRARGRGVYVGRDAAPTAPDQLALAHPLADLNHRFSRAAHMLLQRHTHTFGGRHLHDRALAAQLLAVAELDTAPNLKKHHGMVP